MINQENISLSKIGNMIQKLIFEYGPKILIAIALLIIGLWIIKKVIFVLQNRLSQQKFDESIQKFLISLFEWALKILLFITVLGQLGIQSTSFVAILGAAGLALGLALQGSLANLAGGVLIMIFRPFKVGDHIETQGIQGKVKMIDIFTTKVVTGDNKLVIIPNGPLSNGNITNLSAEGYIALNISVKVPHELDHKILETKLMEYLSGHEKILKNPQPQVVVGKYGLDSLTLNIKPSVLSFDRDIVQEDVMNFVASTLTKIKP